MTANWKLWLVVAGAAVANGHPLCLDGSGPVPTRETYQTCKMYDGFDTCFSPAQEAQAVDSKLASWNVPDGTCKTEFLTKLACSVLDGWAAHLFDGEVNEPRDVAILCNTFAKGLYNACKDVSLTGNPFLTGGTDGTIASAFPTEQSFLDAFSSKKEMKDSYCFDGAPYVLPEISTDQPANSTDLVCIETLMPQNQIPFVVFEPVPYEGRNLVALGAQNGVVSIYDMKTPGEAPEVVIASFLDIKNRVRFQGDERGFLGLAFHKNFPENGRMFISYTCSNAAYCENEDGTVVEEIIVSSPKNVAQMAVVDASAGKLIFTYPQPYNNHNAGQVLFSTNKFDPHLYVMMGDGGSGGDPGNVSQNPTNLLGKILRLDIDNIPNGERYGIPSDNPFVDLPSDVILPEIWAIGVRNPWRNSFDPETNYFYVADVGQNKVEEVSLATKGANLGWNIREGTQTFRDTVVPPVNTTLLDPIIEYTHSGPASITGGYVYRGATERAYFGKYFFADLYEKLFVASERLPGSGKFTFRQFFYRCANESISECSQSQNLLFTFGQDGNRDLYISSMSGISRFISLAQCGLSEEDTSTSLTKAPTASPTRSSASVWGANLMITAFLLQMTLVFLF